MHYARARTLLNKQKLKWSNVLAPKGLAILEDRPQLSRWLPHLLWRLPLRAREAGIQPLKCSS